MKLRVRKVGLPPVCASAFVRSGTNDLLEFRNIDLDGNAYYGEVRIRVLFWSAVVLKVVVDDVRTLLPSITLAEAPDDSHLDFFGPLRGRAVAGRERVARYEPGMIAGLTKNIAARLPRRGRVVRRRRRDGGDRRRLGVGRREARDRDDRDDDQRVAARRSRLRDERRLRSERVSGRALSTFWGLGRALVRLQGLPCLILLRTTVA